MLGIFQDTMANMKWTDIQQYSDKQALVLFPLGVIEEHGPHLCLGTDIYTAHLYSLAIKKKLEERGYLAVIAPPFYWGVCQANSGFIGSFTIRKETVKQLLVDILTSIASFGFKNIYGINAHGDIEHSIAIMEAFKEAGTSCDINARYAFDEWRLAPFGLTGTEPYLCSVKIQTISVSTAEASDVHGGDIETAMIHAFYPELVDTELAKSLPPVPLDPDRAGDWLFGGHIRELSPYGYLGSPASFESVSVMQNLSDYADRLTEAICKNIRA